jgi:putative FmdB family regulatory protein
MPTYEYACTHCGHAFEFFQKITDKPLEICPKCNNKVKRLISGGSGIIFRGSGFYATDYRKKPKSEVPQTKADTCPEMKKGCDACKPK